MGLEGLDFNSPNEALGANDVGEGSLNEWADAQAAAGQQPVGEFHAENMELGDLPSEENSHPKVTPLYPEDDRGLSEDDLLNRRKAA